jgi:hypothetical protein
MGVRSSKFAGRPVGSWDMGILLVDSRESLVPVSGVPLLVMGSRMLACLDTRGCGHE